MKIQYVSDLHLEFTENANYIKKNPIKPTGDILILAGDITLFKKQRNSDWFFDYCSENWKQTYWIYGHNHYNTQDFKIGDTVLLTNQLGYVYNCEHLDFNSNKFIEI